MVRAVCRLEEVMRWGGKLCAQMVGCRCWIWGGAVRTGRRRGFTEKSATKTQLNILNGIVRFYQMVSARTKRIPETIL